MLVLHLTSGHTIGGVETSLLDLARARAFAPQLQFEVGVACDGELTARIEREGVPVHRLGPVRLRRLRAVRTARRQLARLIDERGVEAVVCHESWIHAIFAPAVRRTRALLVFSGHDDHSSWHWLAALAARTKPDLALANSNFCAGSLARLFPSVPLETLYHPLRLELPAAVRASLRSCWQTSLDDIVVLCLSRLDPLKGHPALLAALAELRDLPRWTCWIAGGTGNSHQEKYARDLRDQARRAGIGDRIRFLGHCADVAAVMSSADIFCQPNRLPETFGRSLAEAVICGLPVVTSEFGGALEIVDKNCGRLLPPGDTAALAATLRALIVDETLRARLRGGGAPRIRALCDPRQQMLRLQALLLGAAASRPQTRSSQAS